MGLAGIAITDHECLSSHIKVNQYTQKVQKNNPNFKVALGNEIYLVDARENGIKYYHFILIAKDKIGHKQLRQLSSLAWLNSYYDRGMERVPTLKSDLKRIVRENPGHLIATTACMGGELSTLALNMHNARQVGDHQSAEEYKKGIIYFVQEMLDIFGSDFYIECAPAASKEQIIVNNHLYNIANSFNVKMIIGSDAHYLKKEDRYVHKAYLNSKGGEREVDDFYEYSYLQSDDEIQEHLSKSFDITFSNFIASMYANSMEIYDKIENYSLEHKQTIPKVEIKDYPKTNKSIIKGMQEDYPVLASMLNSEDKFERYWVNECMFELGKLNKNTDQYYSRLEEEARVKRIIGEKLETNMFAYPITLQHYIDMFWECGSLVGAGRGSSCSGLNHYLLGITQLDPIEWELPFWRYLNEERTELGDIDIDLCPSKRPQILKEIKKERGQNFKNDIDEISRENLGCTLIATFGTESTKSTILTACRGYRTDDYPDGIDVDTAQYLTSLVPSERGFLWTLDDVLYGNQETNRKPITTFINEIKQYPGLLDIMQGISGLINKRSSHASGVILFDEDPYEFGCFMRTPKGEVITQYDLHDAEFAGMTKYDFLVTDVQDKLCETISLLQEYGEIEKDLSLREVYDKYFHPNVLNLNNEKCWKALENGEIINIFQFDSDVGSQAAKKIKPKTIIEMSDANGLMRLMTSEKGQETPMEKYVRFKNDISLWYDEMDREGLTKEEQKVLEPYFLKSYGVPPSQEQMMMMLMDKDICGFSLAEANSARKVVGKKQMDKIPELHQSVLDKAKSVNLGKYVWTFGIGPQMGYAFSVIHSLAYSFIGYQTLYIATKWNPIYWNTACLIINSASLENEDEEEDNKKNKTTDYTKNAKAIGEIVGNGIKVSLVDINNSTYSFKPDIENNQILFGMKALSKISPDIIEKIKIGRPYASLKDFMRRCPLTKTAMITLIKAGAFDEIEKHGLGDRKKIMVYYISQICEPKNRLTLQNFNGLIQRNLVPKELEMQVRVFNFTKYLKSCKVGKYYTFDDACITFFNKFYSDKADNIEVINGITCILQDKWDKIYQKEMDIAREWLKQNQKELLQTYNLELFKEEWNKYACGSISKWEMDALCFYHGDHELKNVSTAKYGIVDFFSLPTEPEVDYFFKRGGNKIPIFKLHRIIGTVIGKDDTKSTVTLLTTTGVTTVKFSREYYSMFKKQISQIGADSKKHVVEKSWFTRGTMIMVTGFRRDDMFVGKTYAATEGHQLYKIVEVIDGDIKLQHERFTPQGALEEDDYEG